jgi:7-cyano-7-deazaguanine synthase in queuosine biosynthesis
VIPANDIFIGVNAIDYSGYPDCRPEFIEAFENLANVGTKAGVEGRRFQIHTPLIKLSKADIIRKAVELGVDLSLTHSCYDPTPKVSPAANAIPVSAAQRLSRSRNHRSNSLREKMKRFLRIFELSKNEQRVVLIVIFALLAIA